MGGVRADGLPVQLPDEVRSGQAAHLTGAKEHIKIQSMCECLFVEPSVLVFVGENEYISCMCSVGAVCVYWEYENRSVWLMCLCCVCLEESGRLDALS